MAFFFPVAGPSLNLALTKLANRTVINSTIASTCNREGGSVVTNRKPRQMLPLPLGLP
jgi:hypothetical protein